MNRTALSQRRAESRHLVEQAVRLGPGEALALLSKAQSADPGFYLPILHMGLACAAVGERDRAGSYLAAAQALDPTAGGVSAMAWKLADTLAGLAEMNSAPAAAIQVCQRFLEANAGAPEAERAIRRLSLLDACGSRFGPLLAKACRGGETETLSEAMSWYPGAGFLYRLLGLAQHRHGQFDAAIYSFEEAVKRDPHALPWLDKAASHRALGDSQAEEECYQSALGLQPAYAAALFGLGRLQHEQGDLAEARGNLQKALSLDPEAPWAEAAWGLLDARVALPSFLTPPIQWTRWAGPRGISVGYPEGAPLNDGPSLVHIGGEATFGIELFRYSLLDDTSSGPWRRTLRRIEHAAGWKVETRRAMDVSGLRGQLVQLTQGETGARELRLLVLRERELLELVVHAAGGMWMQAQDDLLSIPGRMELVATTTLDQQAFEESQQRVSDNRNDADAVVESANALTGLADYDYAEKLYTWVLGRDPQHGGALVGLAQCYWKQKKADAVVKTLERMPPGERVHVILGLAYEKRGQHASALEVLQQALKVATDTWRVRLHLAVTYESLHQPDKALEEYGRALEETFDPCAIHLLRAAFFRRQKQFHDATLAARAALDLDPQEVEAHLLLGLAYMDMDCLSQAEPVLKQAQAIDPKHAVVLETLRDLTRKMR